MKKLSIVTGVCLMVVFSFYPPFNGSSQKVTLEKYVDSTGNVSKSNLLLIDSINNIDQRLSAKLDSLITSVKSVKEPKAKTVLKKYFVTRYEAPVAVMKIEFEDKYLLIQWDSAKQWYNLKEIIIK